MANKITSNKIKAFTMAEAILVMSILGVIAAVMIATIKPAEYKQKGFTLLAEKVISELDVATSQIMVNGGSLGYLDSLTNGHNLDNATYQKYLALGKKGLACATGQFKLKDGACIKVATGSPSNVCAPQGTTGYTPDKTNAIGSISIDVNGSDAPNTLCKDQFIIPLNKEGLML